MSKYALGNLLELKRGQDLTKNDMCKGTYPVVGSNGIIGMHNVFNVKAPCITVGRSGTVGAVHYYNENCWAHNTCLYVSDFKNNNPLYLYYLLKNIDLTKVATSTGVPTLNRNFVYPITTTATANLDEQNNIANILGAIDEKIENNDAISAQLEALAKTIYDYWFLQFEFPNEDGKPYKSSGGKMVWNEELKREIPEGWNTTTIGDITINHDSERIPLASKERSSIQGRIPYYGATGIMGYVNRAIFKGDYVLLAEDGSVMDENGYPIIQRISGETWVNNHAHVLEPANGYHCRLLMMILKRVPVVLIKTGSIQMKINQENMNKYHVLNIPDKLKNKANSIFDNIDAELLRINNETQQLTSLRDFLLPLLMNGQVTFKDEATSEEE